MTQHVLLDNITHKDLKIITERSADYGDNISLTGVFPIEFKQVQNQYPIFFKKNSNTGQFDPVALLGFEEGENLFLARQDWAQSYIPLSIQRQPFLIGFQQSTENGVPTQQSVIHLDMNHPRVSQTEGEAVFLAQGGNSSYLEHINSVLLAIHQGHQQNSDFTRQLTDLELIEPFTLEIELNDGSHNKLVGLYTLNEEKLAKLTGNQLEQLHQQGYLQLAYMIVASHANLRAMIELKNKLSA